MNIETAQRINGALCRLWFAAEVFGTRPTDADLATLRAVSVAQCETAAEIIEAENERDRTQIRCTVEVGRIPSLLQLAHAIK